MTCNSAVTFPVIEDTPTTSKANVRLSGVKITLKRVAVKFELSWHGFRDLDSIRRIAEVDVISVRNVAAKVLHEATGNRILGGFEEFR